MYANLEKVEKSRPCCALCKDVYEMFSSFLLFRDILLMCHHGTLITADTVAIAFDDLYYLERACMTQLLAMGSVGREALKILPADIQVYTARGIRDEDIIPSSLHCSPVIVKFAFLNQRRINGGSKVPMELSSATYGVAKNPGLASFHLKI